jgi:hypothetical protein
MFKLYEDVWVLNKQAVIGMATVVDICMKTSELIHYMGVQHALQNKEPVYIVDFKDEMGQGGYLKEDLRSMKEES